VVHSFFDFNLQVRANAALFFVLAGITTNVPTRSEPLIPTSVRTIRRRAHSRRAGHE
jgi:hypothetical protein